MEGTALTGRRARHRSFAFVGALLIVSCGGGTNSCLSCGGGTYEFPRNDPNRPDVLVQSEVARGRITQAFIDFIKPQIPVLLQEALGGSGNGTAISIPIPDMNDIIDVSVAGFGIVGLDLRNAEAKIYPDDLNRMDLTFVEPNGVRMSIQNLRLGMRMNLDTTLIGSDSSCPVFGDLGNDVAAEFDLNILIEPGVGPDPDRNLDIGLTIDDVQIADLAIDVAGSSTYCSLPACQDCAVEVAGTCLDPGGRCNECYLVCGAVLNVTASLVNVLIDLVRPLLNRVLQPVLNNFVQDALAGINGQPAKIEQQVDLAATTGIAAFQKTNPFGIFIAPEVGKFPVLDRGTGLGMEMTVSGGAEAELADCVSGLAPFDMPKGPVPILGGTDSMGRPYHLGFTLASSLINQILHTVHRAGTLCLRISSQDVKDLTNGAFSLNASILSLLASDLASLADDRAPVFMQLVPRNPATFDLGSGEVIGQDPDGNDIVDPLMKFSLQDLGLAFYVLVQDRYIRIFEVTMDVDVGANIVVLPDNTLELAVTKLDIGSFEEVFNEILPNANFAEVLPSLIDLAFSALLSQELKFDVDLSTAVSDALGGAPIYMRVNDIFRDGAQEDYLTLTMTFSSTTATGALSLAALTSARLHEESLLQERDGRTFRPTGKARLVLGDGLPYSDRRALEYQVRVDGGLWHSPLPAHPDDTLTVSDTKLMLPGRHKVEVRARYWDDYTTLDPTPVVLEALVDPIAPSLSGQVRDEAVHVTVQDELSRAEAMTLRARLDDGEWFDLALEPSGEHEAVAQFPLSQVGSAERMDLVARDEIGNESPIAFVRVGLAASEQTGDAAGCACHDVGEPHHHGERDVFALLMLFGLAAAVRFRSRFAAALRFVSRSR